MNRRSPRDTQEFPTVAEALDLSTLPTHPYESYRAIGLNDLLVYTVFLLEGQKQATTFENVTVAAHRLFPGKFSLVGYPKFPDATRVQLVILHLGPKYVGWLEGKKKTSYYLNARGRGAAASASERLGATREGTVATSSFAQDNLVNRTAVETRVARLRSSHSFEQYVAGKGGEIDDVTLEWDAFGLFITADSPTKAETYRQLLEAARRHRDVPAEQFLGWLSKERPHLVGRGRARRAHPTRRSAGGRTSP